MGLIIKGTIPKGTTIFPMKRNYPTIKYTKLLKSCYILRGYCSMEPKQKSPDLKRNIITQISIFGFHVKFPAVYIYIDIYTCKLLCLLIAQCFHESNSVGILAHHWLIFETEKLQVPDCQLPHKGLIGNKAKRHKS